MIKRIFIGLLIFIGLIVLVAAALFIWARGSVPKTDKEFLSQLKGEVVFTRRNAEGVSDIWKVNANGTGETLLYHNNKDKTRTSFPYWSLDGSKIYFLMYDLTKKEKQNYEMNADGKNVKLVENPNREPADFNQRTREAGIKELHGDLFIIKNRQDVLIFKHSGYYDPDFAAGSGAREASWSPDKEYIIFEVDGFITVADKNGRITKITKGSTPDWKY